MYRSTHSDLWDFTGLNLNTANFLMNTILNYIAGFVILAIHNYRVKQKKDDLQGLVTTLQSSPTTMCNWQHSANAPGHFVCRQSINWLTEAVTEPVIGCLLLVLNFLSSTTRHNSADHITFLKFIIHLKMTVIDPSEINVMYYNML